MKGYRARCCDCGLVHVINFFVVKHGRGYKVEFQVWRDERATTRFRRKRQHNVGV